MGDRKSVGLVVDADITLLLPVLSGDKVPGEVIFTGPVNAPIQKGQTLGELVIKPGDLPEIRLPLVAQNDVAAGGFMVRVRTAADMLIAQFIAGPSGAL